MRDERDLRVGGGRRDGWQEGGGGCRYPSSPPTVPAAREVIFTGPPVRSTPHTGNSASAQGEPVSPGGPIFRRGCGGCCKKNSASCGVGECGLPAGCGVASPPPEGGGGGVPWLKESPERGTS